MRWDELINQNKQMKNEKKSMYVLFKTKRNKKNECCFFYELNIKQTNYTVRYTQKHTGIQVFFWLIFFSTIVSIAQFIRIHLWVNLYHTLYTQKISRFVFLLICNLISRNKAKQKKLKWKNYVYVYFNMCLLMKWNGNMYGYSTPYHNIYLYKSREYYIVLDICCDSFFFH